MLTREMEYLKSKLMIKTDELNEAIKNVSEVQYNNPGEPE